MAETPTAVADQQDHVYEEMFRLSKDSMRVKRAHFIAAQYKRRNQKILGVLVVVINVLIGSTLLESFVPATSANLIKLLSFSAALFAGLQTFLNLEKEADCHTRAGDAYSSINRRIDHLLAEYKDMPSNRDQINAEYKRLMEEYFQANDNSRTCFPSDKDLERANKQKK